MLISATDNLITLTHFLFEGSTIDNFNAGSPIPDKAGRLKALRQKGDGRPPYAQHLGQELLREREGVAVGPVPRLQKPPA